MKKSPFDEIETDKRLIRRWIIPNDSLSKRRIYRSIDIMSIDITFQAQNTFIIRLTQPKNSLRNLNLIGLSQKVLLLSEISFCLYFFLSVFISYLFHTRKKCAMRYAHDGTLSYFWIRCRTKKIYKHQISSHKSIDESAEKTGKKHNEKRVIRFKLVCTSNLSSCHSQFSATFVTLPIFFLCIHLISLSLSYVFNESI